MVKWILSAALVAAVAISPVVVAQSGAADGTQASASSKTPGLTNADVVKMVKAGLSPQVVVASIRAQSQNSFDLSPSALIALTKAGVPDGVLVAMQERPQNDDATPVVKASGTTSSSAHALEVTIPAGTPVSLRLVQPLSSDSAKTGETVGLEVASDVVVDGQAVIKRGELAAAKVSKATRQLLTRAGKLELAIESAKAVDGTRVPLEGTRVATGGRGYVTGNDVSLAAGTLIDAKTQADVKVTMPAPR
jgi:hypothetical protein